MTQAHDVNGELIKLRREERGWAQTDLAVRACMSVKQIRQIEEGGVSAFYSESVKISAAKKVAGILGMSPDDLWAKADVAHDEPVVEHEVVADEQAATEVVEPTTHEREKHEEPEHVATELPAQESVVDYKPVINASSHHPQEAEAAKPKTSLWLIAGLFGAALAIAALMRPDTEPMATEPPPPLQVVPSEASDAASAASAALDVASASEASASAAKSVASAPVPAASAASASAVAKPLVAASAPVRPASAQAQPSASAASK
jgi:cytoskeleton protein RodZ